MHLQFADKGRIGARPNKRQYPLSDDRKIQKLERFRNGDRQDIKMSNNKKNISVRLSESDLRRLKDIASRLRVKDSDLFRFAVKMMLSRMMPLLRQDMKGIDVLLTILDAGGEMLRYFEFDSHQIDKIVNCDSDKEKRIAMDDIDLVAIAMLNQNYLKTQLVEMGEVQSTSQNPVAVLRDYLYKKYCPLGDHEICLSEEESEFV